MPDKTVKKPGKWYFYKPVALDTSLAYSHISAVLQVLAAVPSFADIFDAHREEFKEGPMTSALRHFIYLAHTVPQDYLVEPRGLLRILERRDGRFGVRTSQDPAEVLNLILSCVLEELHSVHSQRALEPRFSRFGGVMSLPDLELESWTPRRFRETSDSKLLKFVSLHSRWLKDPNQKGPTRNEITIMEVDSGAIQNKFMNYADTRDGYTGGIRSKASNFLGKAKGTAGSILAKLKPTNSYTSLRKPAEPDVRLSSVAGARGFRVEKERRDAMPNPVPRQPLNDAQRELLKILGVDPDSVRDDKEEEKIPVLGEKPRWCPLEEVAVRGQFKKLVMGSTCLAVNCNLSGSRYATSYLPHFLLPVPIAFDRDLQTALPIDECLRLMSNNQPFDGSGKLWSSQAVRWFHLMRHVGTVRKEMQHIPRVLMLQLMRFKIKPDGRRPKVAPRVRFTDYLDISDIVAPHIEKNDLRYKLTAVISHMGAQMEDPCIFEAYVLTGDRETWYRTCANASHPVTKNAVFSSEAYILVYEKCHFTWNDHVAQSEIPQERLDILNSIVEAQKKVKTEANKY